MAPILTIFGPNRSQQRNLFFEKNSNERRRHRGIVVVVIVAAVVAVAGGFWVACIKGTSLQCAKRINIIKKNSNAVDSDTWMMNNALQLKIQINK